MYTLCNSNEYIFIFERYMRNFNEEIRKMKKITALLLVLAMAVALCACGSSSSTPAADTLVMGTSADYPPYEFQYLDADGNMAYGGIDVSVAQYVADYTGKELKVERIKKK